MLDLLPSHMGGASVAGRGSKSWLAVGFGGLHPLAPAEGMVAFIELYRVAGDTSIAIRSGRRCPCCCWCDSLAEVCRLRLVGYGGQ